MSNNLPTDSFSFLAALDIMWLMAAYGALVALYNIIKPDNNQVITQYKRYTIISIGFVVAAIGCGIAMGLSQTASYRAFAQHKLHDSYSPTGYLQAAFWVYLVMMVIMVAAVAYTYKYYVPVGRFAHGKYPIYTKDIRADRSMHRQASKVRYSAFAAGEQRTDPSYFV